MCTRQTTRNEATADRQRKLYQMDAEGTVFIPILMLTDYFYRQHRYSGSVTETILMVCVIISVFGVVQLFIGMYAWLKHRILDKEQGPF